MEDIKGESKFEFSILIVSFVVKVGGIGIFNSISGSKLTISPVQTTVSSANLGGFNNLSRIIIAMVSRPQIFR